MTHSPATASETQSAKTSPTISSGAFWIAVGCAVAWIVFLAVLTWTTANPVTLNRQQILDSDLILVGRVMGSESDGATNFYAVKPTEDGLWPLPSRESIGIENLTSTVAKKGNVYLFPLKRYVGKDIPIHGDYDVTPTHLPNAAPLIYPATPEALHQLEEILGEQGTSVP